MTVVRTDQDREALTFTIVADLAAPPSTVWEVWSDPRQLERWWGPPTWPATFEQHALVPGSESHYAMTGPDGTKARGWWRITSVDEPRSLEFEDGFSDESGNPDDALPTTRARVDLEETEVGTRMTVTSTFSSLEQMEQLAKMGMVEGMTAAMAQIDGLLVSA
jgi:uncharacterized protein YndB with AHSA1/START domain